MTRSRGASGWVSGPWRTWLSGTTAPSAVFGAGNQPTTVRPGQTFYFRVIATDDRPGLANTENLPLADETISGPITDAIGAFPITDETHIVVVTRNMGIDVGLLPHLFETNARSIGVMGSKRRWHETCAALLAQGMSASDLDRVIAPIGIELHAETPEEIAVSILAEIVALRRTPRA